MSRRGKEKKAEHVAKVLERKRLEALATEKRKAKPAPEKKALRGRETLSGLPPWKRKLIEAMKKRDQRKGQ